MAWKKSSPASVQRFDEIVSVDGAQRGLLFGCPIYVLEGERYATLYQDRVVLRLSSADAAKLIAMGGRAFEPVKGRKSKERVVLPDKISKNSRALQEWVRRAVAYARSG
jgi:TfoX/Sxy family transcriptional regulator of competence genes